MTKSPFTEGPVGPGWKLAWEDAVFRDSEIKSAAALKVAVAIRSRVDSYGIVKNVTHLWIAKWANLSVRAVGEGFRLLVERGHIEILKASRGRGQANEVKIVRRQLPESLRNIAEQGSENLRNIAEQSPESRQNPARKPAGFGSKAYAELPTLPLSLPFILPSGGAPIGAGSLDQCWDVVLARLAEPNRLGKEKVQAWLSNEKIKVSSLENSEVMLIAKTKFIAARVNADLADHLLREWRNIDPTITKVAAKHGEAARSPPGEPSAEQHDQQKVVSLRERLKAKAAKGGS